MNLLNYRGELISAFPISPSYEARNYSGHRGEIHQIVFNHAQRLGVDIRLGQTVSEYWETENAAGVVANGDRLEADVVVGADGFGFS